MRCWGTSGSAAPYATRATLDRPSCCGWRACMGSVCGARSSPRAVCTTSTRCAAQPTARALCSPVQVGLVVPGCAVTVAVTTSQLSARCAPTRRLVELMLRECGLTLQPGFLPDAN
eukprot:5260604-Prymnesium_polylepis.2